MALCIVLVFPVHYVHCVCIVYCYCVGGNICKMQMNYSEQVLGFLVGEMFPGYQSQGMPWKHDDLHSRMVHAPCQHGTMSLYSILCLHILEHVECQVVCHRSGYIQSLGEPSTLVVLMAHFLSSVIVNN